MQESQSTENGVIDRTPRRSRCRNCGVEIARPSWAFSPDFWVHVEPRSGLLGSEDCYYTPRAEPVSSSGVED